MVEITHDAKGVIIGIKINSTIHSPESIALMASQIATLQALVETQRAIIEDLGYQKVGLLMLVTDPAWARRWKAAAKKWYRAYREDV